MRKDFQELANGVIPVQVLPTKCKEPPKSHDEKILARRNRVMGILSGLVSLEVLNRFKERSNARLGTTSPNTEISLYADLRGFIDFCASRKRCPFPAEPEIMEEYLSYMWLGRGMKCASIDRNLASLVKWHKWLEMGDPRKAFKVRALIDKIHLELSNDQCQQVGLRAIHIQKAIDTFNHKVLRDIQDLALLMVAFETMCRRSEVVSFNWDDLSIKISKDKTTGSLFLKNPNSNIKSEGDYLYISHRTLSVLQNWQIKSGLKSGAIFRGISSSNTLNARMSDRTVHNAFRRIARRIGVNPGNVGGRSTRVGAAQDLMAAGIDSMKIMLHARWVDGRMLHRYTNKISTEKSAMADFSQKQGWDHAEGI